MTRPTFRLAAFRLSASFAALAFMQSAGIAHAADAGAATADTAPAAQGDDAHLTEIVVTATKRETNLQKTPISISVLSTEGIKDRHVQSLLDLADGAVPSLRVATFEARNSALTVGIRGIVPFDQNQTARDTGVGIYVDGIYLGRTQGLNAAMFDAQRVEILRGPQGTLFGRNTEGGAVSIVTKEPTGEFGGRLVGGVGNFGSYSTEAHVNLPSFSNIAVKIDGLIQHQDATVKNPAAGQLGWNYKNQVGGRISAKWTPTSNFTAILAYDKVRDENTPNFSQLINYNPNGRTVGQYILKAGATDTTLASSYSLVLPGTATVCSPSSATAVCIAPLSPLIVVSGNQRQYASEIGAIQQPSTDDSHGFSATLKYKVSPDLELRSITGWRGVTTWQYDANGAHRTIFAPNANFSRYSLSYLDQSQFSQELQAVGSLPNIDYAVGLYYFTEQVTEKAATPSTNKWNADGTGFTFNSANVNGAITSGNQSWDPKQWFIVRDSHAKAKSYAAFGQATWSPTDTIHVTAGLRWTKDKRDGALTTVSGVATPYTFTFNNSRVDPLIVLAWDAAPGINLYAKYSTGYRAGGANDRSSNFGAFGPEVVKAWEAGAKMDLFDRKVRLNLAGFLMNRTGTQIDFDFVDTNSTLANGLANPNFNLHTENTANAPGTSKIRGIEADLTVRPVDHLTLGASYAYTYTNVPLTPNPLPGPTFGVPTQVYVVFTPKNAVSGYLDYDVPVGSAGAKLRFHIDANYSDPQQSFQNQATLTESSFIANARLALADIPMGDSGRNFTLAAWARNLLDETHIYRMDNANQNTLGYYGNFNPPRTFGFEASVSF